MNIYTIEFSHTAPKDHEQGIKCLLLAENDDRVYEWLKSEPKIGERTLHNGWADSEEEKEEFEIYDDNYNVIGTETFKQKMIRLKGEMNDEGYDYSDAYYGITLFGWSLLKENVKTDYSELIQLGIVYKTK